MSPAAGPGVALCGAPKKHPTPEVPTCTQAAGWGTDHPGFGRCRKHGGTTPNGKVFARREQAKSEAMRLGVAVDTDPHEALQLCVNILAGQVAFLNREAEKIADGDGLDGDRLHPTIRALNSVLEQLRPTAKAAIDADVAGRQIAIDEMVLGRLAGIITAAVGDALLSPDQESRFRESLTRGLAALDDVDWRKPAAVIG